TERQHNAPVHASASTGTSPTLGDTSSPARRGAVTSRGAPAPRTSPEGGAEEHGADGAYLPLPRDLYERSTTAHGRLPWRVFAFKSAGEDPPERAYGQAIIRAGDSINVAHREGQRHRKALLRHEQGCTGGQAQLQRVEVRLGFRLQQPVGEAAIAPELVLE